MKKLSAITLAICSTFMAAAFAACDLSFGEITGSIVANDLELDVSSFGEEGIIVSYNGEIPYEDIKLVVKTGTDDALSYNYEIQCTKEMVKSGGETNVAGENEVVIAYGGREFTVEYTVKYRVDFMAFDEVFNSQHVLESEEIVLPTPPEVSGYTFGYWATPIPAVMTDNLTIQAHYYNEEKKPPQLRGVERVYDVNATLADITLPSNANGAWVFTDDLASPVGGVGTHEFSVRFIPNGSEIPPQEGIFKVTVTPQLVTFEVTETTFVYDGEPHVPAYTASAPDARVELLGKAETEAGSYSYMYVVNDPNYEGMYAGTYTITKPDVTITVQSYEMKFGEAVPEIEYTVSGFANADILDIHLQQPEVFAIGAYDLTLTVGNQNVNATVVNGLLTVEKGDLVGVGAPSTSDTTTPAIYEHTISTVTLTGDYRGVWTWKTPDAIIDSVETFTSTAVFTPNNSNYNVIEQDVTITNIDKRTLSIQILTNEYVYTGEALTVVYELQEGKTLQVDGLVSKTDVGEYEMTLTINDTYYQGTKDTKLVITPATPVTDFTPVHTKTWNEFLTLEDIELPEGYTWDAPATSLFDAIGTHAYPATFTPADTHNFVSVKGEINVTVDKAPGELFGIKDYYEFTYEKTTVHTLSGITSTPMDGVIVYTYVRDGEPEDEIKKAGTYEVTITLKESAHHTSKVDTTTVVVLQAKNTEFVKLEQFPTYLDKVGTLELPQGIDGKWTWEGKTADDEVGDAGEHEYYAIFTPDDPANVESRRVKVTVYVDQFTLNKPTLTDEERTFTYTGETFTVLGDTDLYEVSNNSHSEVGEYTISFTLLNANNYKWSKTSVDPVLVILTAENTISSVTMEGWTYTGEVENQPVVTAKFGGTPTYKYYHVDTPNDVKDGLPTQAGTYVIIATSASTKNYTSHTLESAPFTIEQATPSTPEVPSYEIKWSADLTLADITLEDGFAWKEASTSLEVGNDQTFTAVYTPADRNYHAIDVSVVVDVLKAKATLTVEVVFGDEATDGTTHIYNGNAITVTAIPSHTEVDIVYTVKGEVVSAVSLTEADTYAVVITLAETSHYEATSWERTFEIKQANVTYALPTWNPQPYHTISDLALPTVNELTNNEYQWIWLDVNGNAVDTTQKVGGPAETVSYKLSFVSGNSNYASFIFDVTLTVGKTMITPKLANSVFTYSGSVPGYEILDIPSDVEYSVELLDDCIDEGTHTLRLTMSDASFVTNSWSDSATKVTTLTLTINADENTISSVTMEGWTYTGEVENQPVVQSKYGGTPTYKYYHVDTPNDVKDGLPTQAGTYVIIATSASTKNYTSDTLESAPFTIAQAATDEAFVTASYTADWREGLTLSDIIPTGTGAGAYVWVVENATAETTLLDAVEYTCFKIEYTPKDTNYASVTVAVTVNVSPMAIEVPTSVTFTDGTATVVGNPTYNGKAWTLATTETADYEIGAVGTATSMQNAGDSMEITFTLKANRVWNGTAQNLTYTVQKAQNNVTSFTYDANGNHTIQATYYTKDIVSYQYLKAGETVWKDELPTEMGKYDVKVIIAESANYNAVEKVFTEAFTIIKQTIDGQLDKTSAVYTGDEIHVTFTLSHTGVNYTITCEGGVVDGDVITVTGAGEYSIVVTINDTDIALYQWNGINTASKTFTFTVTPAENGWADGVDVSTLLEGCSYASGTFTRTYDGTPIQAVADNATTLFGEVVISYYQVAKDGTETQLPAGTYPTDAGNYKIYFTVEETDDYAGFSASVSLTISPLATQITTLPTYTANQYQDQFLAKGGNYGTTTTPKATRVDNGAPADGEFTYSVSILNSSTGVTAEVTVTFTPNDKNLASATATVNVTLKSVAHVAKVTATKIGDAYTGATLNSQIYYGTIEDALKAAVDGDEIWVIPDKTGNVKISDSDGDGKVTVPAGVTLLLPYVVSTNNFLTSWNKDGAGRNPEGKSYLDSYQQYLSVESTHLKSNVILTSGTTLEVKGTLEIAGYLGGGGSGTYFNGATVGNYAQITLQNNAKITVENGGALKLTGFIKGEGGQVIINNGGTLYQPLVLNDHYGGTMMGSLVSAKKAPFGRIQFRNIEYATLRINYGGLMRVYGNLYNSKSAGDDGAIGHAEGLFLGKDSGGALNLTAGGYMTAKFIPIREELKDKLTTEEYKYPSEYIYLDRIEVDIYGGANLDQLSLSILGESIQTKNFDFPLQSCFKITLHSGTFTVKNKMKLLPGAMLTVAEDATLIANAQISVYESIHYTLPGFGTTVVNCYNEKGAGIPAEFWVNGTFEATAFGGIIYSSNPGAKVVVTTATTSIQEFFSATETSLFGYTMWSPNYYTYNFTLTLAKSGATDQAYTAAGTYYADGRGGWYKSGENVTISFIVGGAVHHTATAAASANGYTLTASDVATPTREHYAFSHWCLHDGCTNGDGCSNAVTAGSVLYGNVNVYSAWIADEYTLHFVNVLPDGSTVETELSDVTFSMDTAEIVLTTPAVPEAGANFVGWFTAASGGQSANAAVANLANMAKANGGTVTLYAVWTGETMYTIEYVVKASAKGGSYAITGDSISEEEQSTWKPTDAANVATFEAIKADTTKAIYFDGWYLDSGYTTKWTAWNDSDLNGTTLTLYGRWLDKYVVTFNTAAPSGSTGVTAVDIPIIYLAAGQSYDLSSYVSALSANNSKTNVTHGFNGFTMSGGSVNGNTITATGDATVNVWTKKLTVKAGTISNATIKVGGEDFASGTKYFMPGSIAFTISYNQSKNKTFTISGDYSYSGSVTSYTLDASALAGKTITVGASSESSTCLVAGTLITLADGTQKRVEDLVAGDMLLTVNHFTGAFEAQPLLFNIHENEEVRWQKVANLQFSDGTVLRIAGYHGVFNTTLNEYTYLSVETMQQYIGHSFYQMKIVNGEVVANEVTLVNAWATEEYIKVFAPMTAENINCVAESMLTSTPRPWGDLGYHNHMVFGDGLKYDEAQLEADIQTYGLFTYEELSDYIPYEVYEILPFKYLKIAIGKGQMTYDELLKIFQFMVDNGCM